MNSLSVVGTLLRCNDCGEEFLVKSLLKSGDSIIHICKTDKRKVKKG
jgi:formylmethanofuran dehydrogenase subunit E